MLLTGVIECKDDYEMDVIMNKLKEVRNAKIFTNDLTIAIDYEPSDTETEFEEEEAIARLTDIIESAETHGFSITC